MRMRLLWGLAPLVLGSASPALAATLTVGLEGADYTTIGAAISASRSRDVILVNPGVYTENLDFAGKAVVLRSTGGASTTTIQATSTAIYLHSSETADTVIDGFTLKSSGSYILRVDGASPVISNCLILGARSTYGAYFNNSQATLSGVTFRDNQVTSYTMLATGTSDLLISDATFVNNVSGYGGGLSLAGTARAELTNAHFENNKATTYGGAIYLSGAAYVTVDGGEFWKNLANRGGAVYLDSNTSMSRFSNVEMAGNTASTYGGAIYATTGSLHINDAAFADNVATHGGGLYLSTGARTAILNSTFHKNEASIGGAIYAYRTSDTLLFQNIFSGTTGGNAIEAEQNRYSSRILAWYNMFDDNYPANFGGLADNVIGKRGNFVGDPMLTGFVDNRDPSDDTFEVGEGSPAIDAGSTEFLDADGTRGDLGVGGGDDTVASSGVTVAPTGWGTYNSLKAAVAALSSGASISVYPGLYFGDIDFGGKNVAITSAYGPASTVLTSSGTLFTIDASETSALVIDGFTAWGNSSYAVYALSSSPVFRDMHFRYLSNAGAYVAYHQGGAGTYTGCVFEDNNVGYPLHFRSSAVGTVTGSSFLNNTLTYGALSLLSSASVTATGNTFTGNTSTNYGAAVYGSGYTDLTFLNNRVWSNTAKNGAVYLETPTGTTQIGDNHLSGNVSSTSGGAFYLSTGTFFLHDNAITDNQSPLGGGAYLASSAHTAFINNTFIRNSGTTGGTIYAYNSSDTLLLQNIFSSTLAGVTIHENAATARVLSWYNLFHNNVGASYGGTGFLDEMSKRGNTTGDPKLTGYSADGNFGNDTFTLGAGSAARDAGSSTFKDLDGSTSDLGVGGGDDTGRPVTGTAVVAMAGPATYRTITAAVAAQERGARIVVYPGLYYGNVDFAGKNQELVSAFGAPTTVVVSPGTTFTYDASEDDRSVLDGFTAWGASSYGIYALSTKPRIRNMHFRYYQSSYATYFQAADVELTNCVWEDNSVSHLNYMHSTKATLTAPTAQRNKVTYGGALSVNNTSNVTVTGALYADNVASASGGAVYYTGGGDLKIRSSTLQNNKAANGGAVYMDGGTGQVELRNNLVAFNTATSHGGAVYNAGTLLYAADNRVVENTGVNGGAYYLYTNARTAILNDTIVGNVGTLGGGIYAYRTTDTVIGNSIIAYQYDGHGIYQELATARIFLVHSDIYGNYDGPYGGVMTSRTGQSGNVTVEPKFVAYSVDRNLANDNLALAPFSALIDAGIPSFPDADGTPSDMGFGGGNDDGRVAGYTYTVSAHGTADHRTIQAAITAAKNGDSIAVYPGIYDGDVNFSGKDLRIVGVRGPLATTFATASYGIRLDTGEGAGLFQPSVEGVSVQSRGTYGLYMSGTKLNLTNSHIRLVTGAYAGYAKSATLNLTGVVVEDNTPTTATLRYDASRGTITNSYFRRNRAPNGAALYLNAAAAVDASGSHLLDNRATGSGGAAYVTASTLGLRNSVITTNAAANGGGIYLDTASTVTLNSSLVALNSATGLGGAVYGTSASSSVVGKNNIFMANSAANGGAMASGTGAIFQMTNNDFLENSATASGGALYANSGSTLRAVNNIIAYQEDGEGIYLHASSSYDVRYNDFYQNYNGDLGGALTVLPTTNLSAVPGFVSYSKDRNPTNDDLHLALGSVCIDAGDPSILDPSDGSRSDIGAYGGAEVPSLDFDGDEFTADQGDCDDTDATVFPGAPELDDDKDNDCNGTVDDPFVDQDEDGVSFEAGDCNDANPNINPTATEVCDTLDNNCNGVTDEGVSTTYYPDADTDGYGKSTGSIQACSKPGGYTTVLGDCDDTTSTVNPGATEICDAKDNNCNGQTDEAGGSTWYSDLDSDTYGTSAQTVVSCAQPAGYVARGGDCNEADPAINPGATEVCDAKDNNCDNRIDEGLLTTFYQDTDADSYGVATTTQTACAAPTGYASRGGDCNDNNGAVNPGATEVCDGLDNNCDSRVDEGLLTTFYADDDGDTYGASAVTQQACAAPSGYVGRAGDCNDAAFTINPGATEVCDEKDNNCDGQTDEGLKVTYYADGDDDGYGVSGQTRTACAEPAGYAPVAGDCNDAAAPINPGATEICDGVDNNCDSRADEGFDQDTDGVPTCAVGATPADCDDTNENVFPGNTEVCDEIDNNCNGQVDEVVDGDNDGVTGCAGDCDDANPAAFPGNPEVCDGADNNCDGATDEGFDKDTDGVPTCAVGATPADCNDNDAAVSPLDPEVCNGVDDDCDGQVNEGFDQDQDTYLTCAVGARPADCDDTDADVNPGEVEVCDGVDNNCDSAVDEGAAATFCFDGDNDGFGDASDQVTACVAPEGYVRNCTDLDDGDEDTHPGAEEIPDGVDNDGDGEVDEDTTASDDDGDGYTEDEGDCDDDNVQTHPDRDDFNNGVDDDCDGQTDEDVVTTDGDGDGTSPDEGDCDDTDATVEPGAPEVSDGQDNNCDGQVDEGTATGDDDGDGYTEAEGDCDDASPWTHPDAPEYNDGEDNDCDTQVDEGVDAQDDDGDGYSEDDGDCDDTRGDVSPGADEVEDGVDNNCDDQVDEGTSDFDEDNDGFSPADGDCNDNNAAVNPGAAEVPGNGIDDDCDGTIDGGQTPTPTDEPAVAVILVETELLDFGSVVVGEDAERTLDVQNVGGAALTVSQAEIAQVGAAFEVVTGLPLRVEAGQTGTLTVRFTPEDIGVISSILTLTSDDPSEPEVDVGLKGRGVDEPVPTTPEPTTPVDTATPTETGTPATPTATPTEGTPTDNIPDDTTPTAGVPEAEEGCNCDHRPGERLPSGTAMLLLAVGLLRLRRRA